MTKPVTIPHELQPPCSKCQKPYPLNNLEEWLKWGYVYKVPNSQQWRNVKPYVLCEECFQKVVI